MKTKNDLKLYWPQITIGSVLIIFLILFGVFDLAIAKSFTTYENWFSIGFDMWGKQAVVIPIGITAMFGIVSIYNIANKTKTHIIEPSLIGLSIVIVGTIAFHSIGYKNFIIVDGDLKSLITTIATSIIFSITILSFIATTIMINKLSVFRDSQYISTLWIKVIYALVLLTITTLIVTVFKEIWGRPRPNSVIDGTNEFKYLFEFNFESDRGKSFPSGHTQAAGMFFLLIYFIPKSSKQTYFKIIFLLISVCSILLTGISRIVYHKHFPSDVTFSMLLVGVFYTFGPKIVNSILKK
ncbi:phosphatase PAP2 family protein [Spiroplasma endosymbiont of Othius punctulatus]|uniref:phosphatase PAP2 family protein n=1 Tax=Spiroplasma endosymbiont of Othius punctulatus TaxID=3066289 RepID=UPI0030CD254A